MKFSVGQVVGVPCLIQGGAFTNEYLISIDSGQGLFSGFADARDVRPSPSDASKGVILGKVIEVAHDAIKVKIFGSFFSIAAGTTDFSSDWAQDHLQVPA